MPARLKRAAALGAAIGALGVLLSLSPVVLELEETAGLGVLFAFRGPVAPSDHVAVVGISRDAADAFGLPAELDEWPRSLHAELIDVLSAAGVAVIVFDLIFDEPRSLADDRRLAEAMAGAGNVILLERVTSEPLAFTGPNAPVEAVRETRQLPIPLLKDVALASAPFTLPVVPIKTSQFWTFGRAAGDMPTLPVVALQAFLLPTYEPLVSALRSIRPAVAELLPRSQDELRQQRGIEKVVQTLRGAFLRDSRMAEDLLVELQSHSLAPDELANLSALIEVYAGRDTRYLNYYGSAGTIRTLPFHETLRALSSADLARELAGAVVFVGYSESRQPEQQDDFISVFSARSGRNLSGVEIGATAFANLLERESMVALPMPAHLVVVSIFGVVVGAALALSPALAAIGLAAVSAVLYAGLAYWRFAADGTWLPVAVPLLAQLPAALFAAVLWNYHQVRSQRERIRTAIGYYLPAHVVNRLAHDSVHAGADAELLYGTCLFTDVEQYTTVSEGLDPDELAQLLNAYYQVMVGPVHEHGGFVSDIAGDSMVAIWAASEPDPANRARACTAALEILDAVMRFNRPRRQRELPTGIGLHSGRMLLGNIGAEQRFEYRAVGDIVNTASRLQGLNRLLGTRILASGVTLESLSEFLARPLGTFVLRGKTEAVPVYELFAASGRAAPDIRPLLEPFAAALELFRAGLWPAAHGAFTSLLERFPADGPSRYYTELCLEYRRRPPADWNGAVSITVK